MLANLPVEIILLICQYPESKDLGQLAWASNRMMRIIKKHLPTALEREILFYLFYKNNDVREGRIYLFDSHTNSVEQIAKLTNDLSLHEVATTKDKIFAIGSYEKSFEIFDLNTRQITRGPTPPEWRKWASVAYFKDKLYYLGGREDLETWENTNRVNVLIDGKWQAGPAFPLPIRLAQTITCDEILYVIDGVDRRKIFLLSDDERGWIEIGEVPGIRTYLGVASLNGKIYITGGQNGFNISKSCWCFDPSAPVGSRISQIADMNYRRYRHSLVAANGKLYAIGGEFQNTEKRNDCYEPMNFCDTIEEYDPQTNKWRGVGKLA